MVDIRKIVIIFIIAVLFTIFTFTALDAIFPSPDYSDFCKDTGKIITNRSQCTEAGGNWTVQNERAPVIVQQAYQCTKISESGNSLNLSCDIKSLTQEPGYCDLFTTCNEEFQKANESNKLIWFIISAILGLIVIIYGIYLSPESNDINEWMGTGFMLGGLLNIFVGTIIYLPVSEKIIRPIIILIELVLIIFISYKKLGDRKIISGRNKR